VCAALGHGRQVLVSRGESVEIGGSFRVPEVMEQSGAELVDVGTTKRTRLNSCSIRNVVVSATPDSASWLLAKLRTTDQRKKQSKVMSLCSASQRKMLYVRIGAPP
jgi:seryl-tRNA(Sec) selenium transferase